jgi:hypothetical protein
MAPVFSFLVVVIIELPHLLKKFPLTESVPANITKTDPDPKSVEREKLLNESMAEHCTELKRQVVNCVNLTP